MKNRISILLLAALVMFTSTSCFISLRGGRGRHHNHTFVEPLKNGMENASAVPLKLHQPLGIPVYNPDVCRAD